MVPLLPSSESLVGIQFVLSLRSYFFVLADFFFVAATFLPELLVFLAAFLPELLVAMVSLFYSYSFGAAAAVTVNFCIPVKPPEVFTWTS